ncbi:MAG: DNA-directed RNA polymerase subunit beta, partial [Planctomycetota bacterium]
MSEVIRFGRLRQVVEVPALTELQVKAYKRFLQAEVPMLKRKDQGLESILRETFPIRNYDGSVSLEYIGYDIGQPRYSPDECRLLRLTFGAPLKVRLRLTREVPVEEDVYLGDIPRMIGGGAFIINGAERVIVNQLHRSPGVDFMEERTGDRRTHSCWIVPERGSWIEIAVTKKDSVSIRIDQGGKIPATTFLRACSEEYSTDPQILRTFHETKEIRLNDKTEESNLIGRVVVQTVTDPEKNEPIVETGQQIVKGQLKQMLAAGIKSIEIVPKLDDVLIVNTILEDDTKSHKEALAKIYARLRPGTPQTD